MSLTEARFHDLVDALQEALEDAFDASDLDLDLDVDPGRAGTAGEPSVPRATLDGEVVACDSEGVRLRLDGGVHRLVLVI